MLRSRWHRVATLLVVLALPLSACGGGEAASTGPDAADDPLSVLVASFDLAVGEDRRLLAGLLTADRALVAFGEVTFQLGFLGEETATDEPVAVTSAPASFLPVPGLEPEADDPGAPTVLVGERGTGVYESRVDLDRPGMWGLRVVAELADGTVREGQAVFQVLPEPEVLDVGDEAPRTRNLTIADVESGDADPVAVDSRAQGDEPEIPDHHLHDTTIAEELDAGRPVVVVVSTPLYCVSRFCGPLTDVLADLADGYADTARFVHLEVWRDFEEQDLNDAAAEWIQTETGGNEPWVFVIDEDGTVVARWDNVLDVAAFEATLQEL